MEIQFVRKHKQLILDAFNFIWNHAETGYKEWQTHAYLEEAYARLGYEITLAGNIPGFTVEVDTGRAGPTIAIFGELDSLVCESHPDANKETGAVHACGHCAQSAALLGIAAALKEEGALDGLCGKIRLVAVPAEELIEIEYRNKLIEEGTINYVGGKPEFMYRGLLDGVDMAFMVHTSTLPSGTGSFNGGSNGFINKEVIFEGVAAHAGGSPYLGVNALYAANVAITAVNALRETFKDNSHIRFHPIITEGGTVVNAIPERVRLESYVRGVSMKEVREANLKINRAIAASAAAMGANVIINDTPGFFPRKHPESSFEIVKNAMEKVLDKAIIVPNEIGTGCSDMGDISTVMPALHPYIGGATGNEHGKDYKISDPDTACVKSAEMQYALICELLKDNAKNAKKIIEEYEPEFKSIEEYFEGVDKLNFKCRAVNYDDKSATITYSK